MSIRENLLSSAAIIFAAMSAAPAFAQEGATSVPESADDGQLSEITVIAQKRSENMQKVPISITAIEPQKLAETGVLTTESLGNAVPGLVMLNNAGVLIARLRGVGTTTASAGAESPVATYIDGVYIASGADININMADVSQVAVLKGPQGTLFGRNATGGVLQFTTRDPSQNFELDASTGIDNYATWRSHLYAGGGVSDNLAAGFSVSYITQGKGWGKNIATGKDVRKYDDDITIRGKLVFDNGPTEVKLSGDYHYGVNSISSPFRPFPGYENNMIFPVTQPKRKWSVSNFIDPVSKHDGYGATLSVKQDAGFADIVSITAYRDSTAYYRFVASPTSVPSVSLEVFNNSEQFSQEVQLVSPSNGPFKWVVGGYYFWNDAGTAPGISVDILLANLNSTTVGYQKTESLAGFAQGTLDVTDSTRITAGFRYTYEKKDGLGSGFLTFLPSGPTIPTFTNIDSHLSYKKPTWRIALDQDLGPDVIAYATYSRGFKSGGITPTNASNAPFDPEQIDAYELGLKSELFDRKVRFNAAAFYYDYAQIQVNRFLFDGTAVIYNGDGAEIYGLEGDFEAQLSSSLHVSSGFTWLKTAKFLSFPEAQFSTPRPNNGPLLFQNDATGNRLPYAPKLTFTAGIDYSIGNFLFNVNDSYNSGYYGEVDNRLRQKSFHFVGASVTWKSDDSRYSVRLWGNNLLNEAVASQIATVGQAYLASYPNAPRTYGVTLSAKY